MQNNLPMVDGAGAGAASDENENIIVDSAYSYLNLPYVQNPDDKSSPDEITGEFDDHNQTIKAVTATYSGKIHIDSENQGTQNTSHEKILEKIEKVHQTNYLTCLFLAMNPLLSSLMSIDPSFKTDSFHASLNLWLDVTGLSNYKIRGTPTQPQLNLFYKDNYIFKFLNFNSVKTTQYHSIGELYSYHNEAKLVHVFLCFFENEFFLLVNKTKSYQTKQFRCIYLGDPDLSERQLPQLKEEIENKVQEIFGGIPFCDFENFDDNKYNIEIKTNTDLERQIFIIVKETCKICSKLEIETDEYNDNFIVNGIRIFLETYIFFCPVVSHKQTMDKYFLFYYCLFLRFKKKQKRKKGYENQWAIVDGDEYPTVFYFRSVSEKIYLKWRHTAELQLNGQGAKISGKNQSRSFRFLVIKNVHSNIGLITNALIKGQFNRRIFMEIAIGSFYEFFLQDMETNFLLFALFDVYFKKMQWVQNRYEPTRIDVKGGILTKKKILSEWQKTGENFFCTAAKIKGRTIETAQQMLKPKDEITQESLFFDYDKQILLGETISLADFFHNFKDEVKIIGKAFFYAEDPDKTEVGEPQSIIQKFKRDEQNEYDLCYIYSLFSFIIETLSRQIIFDGGGSRYIAKKQQKISWLIEELMTAQRSLVAQDWSYFDEQNRD